MMNGLFGFLLGLVVCGIGFAIYLYLKKREVKNLIETAIELHNGFMNQRFRVHFSNPSLTEFCIQLNMLIDHYQKISIKFAKLEKIQKQMLSNVSHDLRTPLTAILGYIESVLDDETLQRGEINAQLQIAHKKGLNLSRLLQQFFDYVKLEAEDQPLPLERLNLIELVKETVLLFFQTFTEREIMPIFLFPDEPIYIMGHAPSLERVVSNLTQNALNYGTQGNEYGIKIEKEGQNVVMEIWDKGKGIPSNDLPYIFERLYTGIPSRNRKLQGSGLGLAITKILVEKHHGTIDVTSVPNKKTSFIIHLPSEK
ncbi:MAG: HAMP domain-containing sensor histidine kinase [Bacillota bacterium]|nr:HAMP domain-containing sensor histidine kinase [Bacillota bacterium]